VRDAHWRAARLLGLSFVPFLRSLDGATAIRFLVAGAVYVVGAVGVEHFTDDAVNSLHYNMWTAPEEGVEMFGAVLLIHALLDLQRGLVIRLEIGAPQPSASPQSQ